MGLQANWLQFKLLKRDSQRLVGLSHDTSNRLMAVSSVRSLTGALDEFDCTAVNDECLVRRHQAQWFEKRLSKQHPVKWVSVM
jgi:hypothetical protein